MKPLRHATILAITATVSATALFAAVTMNLNTGQSSYNHHGHDGYDAGYQPPTPPGYQYYAPGIPPQNQGAWGRAPNKSRV